MGEISVGRLVCTRSRCSTLREGNIFQDSLTLMMPVLGLHVALAQVEHEARLQFLPVATLEPSPLLLLQLLIRN